MKPLCMLKTFLVVLATFAFVGCTDKAGESMQLGSEGSEDSASPQNPDAQATLTITSLITNNTLKSSDATSGILKLSLSKPATSAFSVNVSYSGSEYSASDFVSPQTTVNFAVGDQVKNLTITPAAQTATRKPHKSFNVSFATNADLTINNSTHALKLVDGREFYFEIERVAENVNEGDKIKFIVAAYDDQGNYANVNFDIKLRLKTYSGTYSSSNLIGSYQDLVIPAGSSTASFEFATTNNLTLNGTKSVTLTYEVTNILSDISSSLSVSYNILDDEENVVSLSRNNCNSLAESAVGTTCTINVSRQVVGTSPLVVYLNYGGTATAGSDYVTPPASVTIPANQLSALLTLTAINDSTLEDMETVIVSIATNSGYSLNPSYSSINVNISDNDNTPENRSIEITATAVTSPATALNLSWTESVAGLEYTIYRRELGTTNLSSWGSVYAKTTSQSYSDTQVTIGKVYEYKVSRGGNGLGFITATVQRPYIHNRGDLLVVAESTVATTMATDLANWYKVLAADGWNVTAITVAKTDTVPSVKAKIIQKNSELQSLKAVLLFGHVPVPYSGQIAPDGHTDHSGAWSADGYYGDLTGNWTDTSVNTTSASRAANRNIPGDGKFDQSYFPAQVTIAVGRVDMNDMPAFSPLTEVDLLRRYINKNIAYRQVTFTPTRRALIDDNFGDFSGESFSYAAWNWFGSLVGKSNTTAKKWLPELNTESYLWSYGCGGSGYTSIGGVASTANFAANNTNSVFTATFGSYFGDWDSQNNALRAVIASPGTSLTNVWSGRPKWMFHSMSVGEPIATSVLISQNAPYGSYYTNAIGPTMIMIGLMGDPTLRDRMVIPVTNLSLAKGTNSVLSWTASTETSVEKYYVYGSNSPTSGFQLLGSVASTATQYSMNPLVYRYYQVRTGKLDTSLTGTYYNLSTGAFLDSNDY